MKRNILFDPIPADGNGQAIRAGEPFHGRRSINFGSEKPVIDKEARTVELSFSSEFPVQRWGITEILVHNTEACDLSRLNNGHPLLLNHNGQSQDGQIGVVERAWIDESTRKGRAVVRFSRGADADEVFNDVIDGIRRLVSVGYEVTSWLTEDTNGDGEPEVYRAVKWTPYEISIVSVPADTSVGIGRSQQEGNMNKNTLYDPGASGGGGGAPTATIDFNTEREKIRNDELKRVREIQATGAQFKARGITDEDVQKYISEGKSPEEFNKLVLERVYNAKPIEQIDPNIGMSRKDAQRFSLTRAIYQRSLGRQLDGIEKEASEAHAKKFNLQLEDRNFFIPNDVQMVGVVNKRALSAGVYGSGGATIETSVDSSNMVELLRKRMVVQQAGARVLNGLQGDILIPKHTGAGTAYWMSENGDTNEASQTFKQLALTPKRCAAKTTLSKKLIMQSSIDVEMLVRDDLTQILALAQDKAALEGLGAAGEPLGLLNTPLIGAGTGGALSTTGWANMLSYWSAIATANADVAGMSWITTAVTSALLQGTLKATSTAVYLQENDRIINRPVYVTNQLSTEQLIFGNFNDLIIANWAGLEIVVDQVTGAGTDQVKIYVKITTDIGVRNPVSFAKSTTVLS